MMMIIYNDIREGKDADDKLDKVRGKMRAEKEVERMREYWIRFPFLGKGWVLFSCWVLFVFCDLDGGLVVRLSSGDALDLYQWKGKK